MAARFETMHLRRRTPFTLLEILVAITVMAILMPAVLACFFTGLRAYRKCYDSSTIAADAHGAMALLQSDLNRAVLVDTMSNAYEAKKLSFVIQDPQSAFQRRITYSLSTGTLTRESQPLTGSDTAYETAELITDVTLLAFQYRRGQSWESKVTSPDVPLALRIQLQVDRPDSTAYYENGLLFPFLRRLSSGGGA